MNVSVVAIVIGSLVFFNAGASFAQPVTPSATPGTPVPTPVVSPVSSQPVDMVPGTPSVPTAAPAVPAAPAPSPLFLVPRDTPIVVRTKYGESSYSAKTGAKIRYIVTQDAIVDGRVVAKSGDTADGQVEEGQNGESGKAANLRVSVDDVYNFCGDTVHVEFDRTESRKNQGVFGSKKDVRIDKGQRYVAVTDRPQRVCTEATTATSAPIPAEALRTNEQ